jgi:hypothetical protein
MSTECRTPVRRDVGKSSAKEVRLMKTTTNVKAGPYRLR